MTSPVGQAPSVYTNEGVRNQLELLKRLLGLIPVKMPFLTGTPGVAVKREEMEAALDALSVALTYFDDAQSCLNASAFIAGGIVGAATLEALLMALLVLRKDEVIASRVYLHKTSNGKRTLLEFLRHADLGGLIEIAQELDWFHCDGIPMSFEAQFLSQMVPTARAGLIKHLENIKDLGLEAARTAKHFRNLVHPGRCIRDKVDLKTEDGMTGCLFLLLAFSALLDNKLSTATSKATP